MTREWKLVITLDEASFNALMARAVDQYRTPAAQLRWDMRDSLRLIVLNVEEFVPPHQPVEEIKQDGPAIVVPPVKVRTRTYRNDKDRPFLRFSITANNKGRIHLSMAAWRAMGSPIYIHYRATQEIGVIEAGTGVPGVDRVVSGVHLGQPNFSLRRNEMIKGASRRFYNLKITKDLLTFTIDG